MNDLVQVKFNDEVVITTKILAEVYGCEDKIISNNFNRNKDKFTEGKHYYKLEGEALKEFCNHQNDECKISPKTRTLYLWTKRGASRHCKMLGTDEAWDMFDTLEESYFNPRVPQLTTKVDSYMIEDPIERAKRWIEEQEEKRLLEQELDMIVTSSLTVEESKKVINRYIKAIAKKEFGGNYKLTWGKFYQHIDTKLDINIKNRKKKNNQSWLSTLSDEELRESEIIVKCWAKELKIDVEVGLKRGFGKIINLDN